MRIDMTTDYTVYETISLCREAAIEVANSLEAKVPIYFSSDGYALWSGEEIIEWISPTEYSGE